MAMQKLSAGGKHKLQNWEGCELVRYKDSGGNWTIGTGRLIPSGEPQAITQDTADKWLDEDVQKFESVVHEYVLAPLTQNQFDALVIFAFNVGVNAFRKSTMRKLLNQRKYAEAAEQFKRWVYVGVGPDRKVCEGLVNRRNKEKALFETP